MANLTSFLNILGYELDGAQDDLKNPDGLRDYDGALHDWMIPFYDGAIMTLTVSSTKEGVKLTALLENEDGEEVDCGELDMLEFAEITAEVGGNTYTAIVRRAELEPPDGESWTQVIPSEHRAFTTAKHNQFAYSRHAVAG